MLSPDFLRRQPQWLVFLEALILVGSIGWVDYATGWEWSFFVFYALPIVIVVWRADRRIGFLFASLCALIWWAAQIDSNPYQTALGFALAVFTRLFYFSVVVVAASAVKAQRDNDKARIKMLEQTRELERDILRASEREQRRIGRDLHDGLGPHLAAMGYAADFLSRGLREKDRQEAVEAEELYKMAKEGLAITRELARGIFPVQMDELGLSVALEDLTRITSRLTGINVSLLDKGDTHVEGSEVGMHLYRIAQEAVNNAAKHSGAKNVTIGLSRTETALELVIADDGRGMPPSRSRDAGMGLHSMRYRAEVLGGTVDIQSSAGEGTTVSCQIPLRQPAPTPVAP